MKKLFLSIATAGLLFAGCGEKAKTRTTDSILWKVTGNGLENPSYLLGTHHFASVEVLDNFPAYADALQSAVQVAGEVDMENLSDAQILVIEKGSMPEGTSYHDLLGAGDYEKLDALMTEFFGAGLDQFGALKPAMISTMVTQLSYAKVHPEFNLATHISIDGYIQNIAREQGKEVIGLETIEEQVEVLLNFEPLEAQAASLLCSLEHDELGMQQLTKLTELYSAGDLAGMHDLANDTLNDPCPSSEEFRHALIKLRNDRWMEQIPSLMGEGSTFIAVGALHLTGEEGIIEQLRRSGYTVESIR
ncbi:MAG: TraB/GumN family protein [Rikenellaceae bacterium]|nr:TraB/GumN family protein [Rikenellaceae bacterium]